ncbi:ribonuclease MRP protein subunit POP4-like isoform X2 [Malus sylvestris]|uniref:ribonuclease MRP protein subunit POP4-like isoform X2 n=1 Tax=Malus sylvestris TaxID=3752 RepID=UPI0021ACF5EE|nr:ribonuclease MRP protein subunit POP4-like isoform X2 [Malus sylvestris]
MTMAGETIVDDQRQRTLKALERRFEAAQVELDLHQKKTVKRSKTEEAGKKSQIASSSAVDSSPNLANPSASSSTPFKKGAFTFSGYINSQEIDESGPTYAKLVQSVDENLLATSVEVSGGRKESKVDKVLHELLQNGDSAQKYMQGSRSKRIDNWILLDNYVQGRGVSTGSHARALQIHSKRSKKHMSMKQQKRKGLFDFPKDFHSFDKFKPMHEMWKGYIVQLLKTTGKNQLAQCILSADLHGAIISVAECKVTSYTGVSGIMIRETAETFGIITQDDKFRVVPKKFSVFIFQVDCWKITLHGDKLTSRNLGL